MKRISLILILFMVITVSSQTKNSAELPERVERKKPTVYLDYVCQDEKQIYLRMYNNTIWLIRVGAEKQYFPTKRPVRLGNGNKGYALPNDEKVPIHYYIEKDELENIKKIKIPYKELYSINGGGPIISQDSILFSIPIGHLQRGLKIFVQFSYEWELTESSDTKKEPEHRVYFRGSDISSANTEIEPKVCREYNLTNKD